MKRWTTLFFVFVVYIAKAQQLSFKDVQPILIKRCAGCHRNGGAAPFPLLQYQDFAKRVSFLEEVITKNYMPPWTADAKYCDFSNSRALTVSEKETLLQWLKAGAPKGKESSAQNDDLSLLSETVYHRQPDLRIEIPNPFLVKGDNSERFVMFKIPLEFTQMQNVEALEFYCNNKKIIHHINYGFYEVSDTSIDIRGGVSVFNLMEDGPKYKQDPFALLMRKMVYYTGWIPGTSFESYPKGFGWSIPKRGVLLFTVHYSAVAADENSEVGLNIFLQKNPITRPIQIISLGSGGIGEEQITPSLLIPANTVQKFSLKVNSKSDRSFLYVWPHMHYLGKEFTAYAITPANDTIKLIHIPNWDFRWQELYKFKQLIHVPAGSSFYIDCVYDNTAANPNNPNSPPKTVYSTGGMDSKNEMMTMLLIYTPYQEGDEELKIGD